MMGRPRLRKQFEDLRAEFNGLRENTASKDAVADARKLASGAHDAADEAHRAVSRARSDAKEALDAAEAGLSNKIGDLTERVDRHHEALTALAAAGQEAAAAPAGEPAQPSGADTVTPIKRARKTS